MTDEEYMKLALKEAEKARKKDEVPVGAVIVRNGKILAKAHNLRESKKDPLAHAEILAIRKASKKLKGWRLLDTTLYVTLEPCTMCAGAVINARIPNLCFGAYDSKAGAFCSVYHLNEGKLNHTLHLTGGVMEKECSEILTDYFKNKRKKKRK